MCLPQGPGTFESPQHLPGTWKSGIEPLPTISLYLCTPARHLPSIRHFLEKRGTANTKIHTQSDLMPLPYHAALQRTFLNLTFTPQRQPPSAPRPRTHLASPSHPQPQAAAHTLSGPSPWGRERGLAEQLPQAEEPSPSVCVEDYCCHPLPPGTWVSCWMPCRNSSGSRSRRTSCSSAAHTSEGTCGDIQRHPPPHMPQGPALGTPVALRLVATAKTRPHGDCSTGDPRPIPGQVQGQFRSTDANPATHRHPLSVPASSLMVCKTHRLT